MRPSFGFLFASPPRRITIFPIRGDRLRIAGDLTRLGRIRTPQSIRVAPPIPRMRFRMARFTSDELRRIQATLRRRFAIRRRADVLDVGFGPGYRAGRADAERPWCACFYVHRKRRRCPAHERLPRRVRFRVKRGRRFEQFTVPTDVIELNGPCLSGCVLSHASGAPAMTGLIVAWRERASSTLTWAVITVGHAFPRSVSFPEPMPRVVLRGQRGARVAGRLLARALSGGVDAAVVEVQRYDLVRSGIITPQQNTRGLVIRSVDEISRDEGAFGTTHPGQEVWPFVVRAYLPTCLLFVQQIGPIDHVVHAHRAPTGAFRPGTSGSLWRVASRSAAMQFGGLESRFEEGFAQALASVLPWASAAVTSLYDVIAGSFRIVATI